MSKKLKRLADVLTPKDAARLNHIREFARNLWAMNTFQHPFFTLHGPQHCQQVERIIGDILALDLRDTNSVIKTVDSTQSFYLLASVWLHDTGMLVPPTESEQQAAMAQKVSAEEWIAREHHKRSKNYVEEHAKDLGLEDFEASLIGKTCEAHRDIKLTDLPGAYPNVKLLGALLRAADELDLTRARAPVQVMGLLWEKMDSLSRWHWAKQYCIADAKPRHEVVTESVTARLFCLTYEYGVCLPQLRLLEAFKDRLMRPIRDVLETQNVNLILQTTGIAIAWNHFELTPLISDPVLFGTTKLSDCLDGLLDVPVALPNAVLAFLEQLRTKNPPAAALLRTYCQELADAASHGPAGFAFERALIQYMDALSAAFDPDLGAIDAAYDSFRTECRKLLKDAPCGKGERHRIEEACRMLAWLAWRLASFYIGDESTKERHLATLHYRLGDEADDLLQWAKENEASQFVRQAAGAILESAGGLVQIGVLWVEDEPQSMRSERLIAEKLGWHITQADKVSKGLELVRDERFDLVVTDLLLPRNDFEAARGFRDAGAGVSFIESIREPGRHGRTPPDVPILVITAVVADQIKAKVLAKLESSRLYLSKPLYEEAYLEIVRELTQKLAASAQRSSQGVAVTENYDEQEHQTTDWVIQGKLARGEFDVFLCYNTADRLSVKEIGERLKTKGILPWLDQWNLRPGLPFQKALEKQIKSVKSAAVFVGPSGVGPWQDEEIAAFLRQFVKRKCPVIPVILPDSKRTPKLPLFLQAMTWVDFRQKSPDPLEQLIYGITGKHEPR